MMLASCLRANSQLAAQEGVCAGVALPRHIGALPGVNSRMCVGVALPRHRGALLGVNGRCEQTPPLYPERTLGKNP